MSTSTSPAADPKSAPNGFLQFGDVHFAIGNAPGRAASASAERLHLVVQKGRLFQQEHPDVPVLLDKGRYLVVELDPSAAKALDHGDKPCYTIEPLPTEGIVFDTPAPRASRSGALPWVQSLVDSIVQALYKNDLTQLTTFPTRLSTSAHYRLAAKLVQSQLKTLGYQARLQNITVNGAPSVNVIADKVGQGPAPRGVVIVGAHLDSINIAGGAAASAPGADDDGSGSAGVLAIARALKDHPSIHDLRLILFGGEEQGLFGSKQYVASLSTRERKRVLAMVHMDMIATMNTAQASVLLEGSPLSKFMIDGLAEAAGTYTHLQVQTSLHPFNSDHVSFLNAGVPAVLTIEGTDDANHNIHSANDTMTHINFDLALEILRMNTAFVAQTAGKLP